MSPMRCFQGLIVDINSLALVWYCKIPYLYSRYPETHTYDQFSESTGGQKEFSVQRTEWFTFTKATNARTVRMLGNSFRQLRRYV